MVRGIKGRRQVFNSAQRVDGYCVSQASFSAAHGQGEGFNSFPNPDEDYEEKRQREERKLTRQRTFSLGFVPYYRGR